MASTTRLRDGSPPPPPPSRRRPLPPPPTPPPSPPRPQPVNTTDYPRRPGKEPVEPSSPRPRIRSLGVQDDQELSITDNPDFRRLAKELFDSNDLEHLQTLVKDFAESSDQNSQAKAFLNFCARQYPNAFSLMLSHLLNSPLPPNIRIQTVALLHKILNKIHAKDMLRIHRLILLRLKTLLLQSLQIEDSLLSIVDLSETVSNVASRVYKIPMGGWEELLEYLIVCIYMDSESRQEMGLKMFLGLPDKSEKCPHYTQFWESRYQSLHRRIFQVYDSPSQNIKALAFDASASLVRILKGFVNYEEIDDLLLRMMEFLNTFHIGGQTDIVLKRFKVLADLAPEHGSFFLRHLDLVFQTVLQIAETADVSNDLKCAAIQVFKGLDEGAMDQMSALMMSLSREDIRRVITFSLQMLLYVEDTSAWYDVNSTRNELAGKSESYRLGAYLIDRVCFEGNDELVLPLGIEMITTYLLAEDWQPRHAAMVIFGAIGEGCRLEMNRYSQHAKKMLSMSLNDPHPRVRWAAIDAIKCISEDPLQEEPTAHAQYLNQFLPELVTTINSSHYPRLQAHAAIAIRCLLKNCGDKDVINFWEGMMTELLELLKNDKQKLQEVAAETLKTAATSFPAYFHKYYDETMSSLKAIVFHYSNRTKLLLRARTIECMSTIVSVIEQKGRESDVNQAMVALFSLRANVLKTDHAIKIHMLKALSQLCKLPTLIIGNYFDRFMPMLLQSAKLDTNLMATSSNSYANKTDYILLKAERASACGILSYCAGRFRERFVGWAAKVAFIFRRLICCCSDTETQRASVSALPNLLRSVQNPQGSRKLMVVHIVKYLVEALHKEKDEEMRITMLESLNGCIQISGSVFTDDLIKQIAEEINHILSQQSLKKLEMEGEEAEIFEEGFEMDQDEEIIQSANCLLTMINAFKDGFLPYVEETVPNVALLWGAVFPSTVKEVAISIFTLLVNQCPDKMQMYYSNFTSVLLDACRNECPHLQREAARGIGSCALSNGRIYIDANVAINSLHFVIEQGNESDRAETYDVAVSALGKICEFCRDSINGPDQLLFRHLIKGRANNESGLKVEESLLGLLSDLSSKIQVVPTWLNLLPLRNNIREARYAHDQLCRMLERLDKDLLGPNEGNLPKIRSILREILDKSDYLATEETTMQIIFLLTMHGGMP